MQAKLRIEQETANHIRGTVLHDRQIQSLNNSYMKARLRLSFYIVLTIYSLISLKYNTVMS